jgi:hypothetical protein
MRKKINPIIQKQNQKNRQQNSTNEIEMRDDEEIDILNESS